MIVSIMSAAPKDIEEHYLLGKHRKMEELEMEMNT